MDRRTFCICSAVGALGVAAACARGESYDVPDGVRIPLHQVLFDSRFASSRAFGAAGARGGHTAVALQGDVTAVWLRHLQPAWAAGGGAIAGMTTAASLFCLEQVAKDQWMRVVVRIDHRRSTDGGLVHRVTAAEPMVSRICATFASSLHWPDASLGALSACVRSKNQPRVSRTVAAQERDASSSADMHLVSWVIAA
jgi:hypothetical protein